MVEVLEESRLTVNVYLLTPGSKNNISAAYFCLLRDVSYHVNHHFQSLPRGSKNRISSFNRHLRQQTLGELQLRTEVLSLSTLSICLFWNNRYVNCGSELGPPNIKHPMAQHSEILLKSS